MPNDDDLNERLRRLGFRLPRDAFAAFLTHLHKSRVSPTETSSNSPTSRSGLATPSTSRAAPARPASAPTSRSTASTGRIPARSTAR